METKWIFNASSSLTNFEIQKYYQNEPRFNVVFSRDNLPECSFTKINDGAYVKKLDEYSDIGIYWIALWVNNNDVNYFDCFGVEHVHKEIKAFIGNKNIKTNIFRLQAYDLVMCGYFCNKFIDLLLAGETLTEYTNIFSSNNFKKIDDITLKFFYEQCICIKWNHIV